MQYLISFLLSACLVAYVPYSFAEKKEEPKASLSKIKEKINTLKKELTSAQQAQKDATDALKASEVAISNTNRKLYDIQKLQKQNEQKLSKLNVDTNLINQQLSEQQKRLSEQFYNQYTQGQKSYLQLILEQKHPSQMARDLEYFSYISKARVDLIKKMQRNLESLHQLNQETSGTLQEVSKLKQAQEAERLALELQKTEKSNVVKTLSSQISSQNQEIKKLARDEINLTKLVEKLAKAAQSKEKERKQQASQQNEMPKRQSSKQDQAVFNNNSEPTQAFSAAAFASLKGKLSLPVKGQVINRLKDLKGLLIKSEEGTPVKSIASGKVVYADWMRGYGNIIIISHGNGYMSLYGYNQSLLKSENSTVNVGDVIATVGNTGGNSASGLYFALRQNGITLDPLSWSNLK
jgi:septal ring factor EnvC (AmiA/AmiB activator)